MKNIMWTDQELSMIDGLKRRILEENDNQLYKWGIQKHSPFEWMTYLTEEVGETAEAISELVYRNGDWKKVCEEAIQVATLALKIAEMAQVAREQY